MSIRLSFDDIAREVVMRAEPGRVNLVAVDGHAGSGKSTFAKRLAVLLQSPVIEMDDFVSWNDLTGWWPRFEQQVLQPLGQRKPAHYQRRDWEGDFFGDSLKEWRTVEPAPVMILEGVTSSRQAIADQLTLAVWVEAPLEVCLERGLKRDGSEVEQQWRKFHKLEEQFFYEDNTRWRAELIIDSDPEIPYDPEVEVVLAESS